MPARPITVLALLQIFLIVASFLVVGFLMKLHGYPDGRAWPAGPIFFREKVFFLLLATVLWSGAAVFAAALPGRLCRVVLIIGAVLTIALGYGGIRAAGLAARGPKQPLRELPGR